MKKLILIIAVFTSSFLTANAQDKIFTKTGKVSFYSDSPLEKIEAHNSRATSVIEISTGAIEFSVLIKGFEFEKALMQEHFNENYMESDEYPKATFKGKITNIALIDFKKNGEYNATIEGELTMHGVTQKIITIAKINVKEGKISASGNFQVALKDYKISRPKAVAEVIDIKIEIAEYAEMPKK